MASPIQRPEFAEGEVLRAEDLNAAFAQSRARDARHLRQGHRWGVVEGLELVGASTPMGYEVTLKKGVARDARGREIVVADDQPVAPPRFALEKDLLYPVFLIGTDEPSANHQLGSVCGSQSGSRTTETFSVEVRRPAEAKDWEANQGQVGLDEGPDAPVSQDAPKVLVGFVQFDPDAGAFRSVAPVSGEIAPRRAGARADVVESSDGKVLLVLGPDERNKDNILSVRLGEGESLLTVSARGDLTIPGAIKVPGNQVVHHVSGMACDGVKLPLPSGLAESDVDSFNIHVSLTPSFGFDVTQILECRIDGDRQLRCLAVRNNQELVPWVASYLLVFEPGAPG